MEGKIEWVSCHICQTSISPDRTGVWIKNGRYVCQEHKNIPPTNRGGVVT